MFLQYLWEAVGTALLPVALLGAWFGIQELSARIYRRFRARNDD